MLTRIIFGAIYAVVFLGVLLFMPSLCLAVMLAAVVILASYELLRATKVPRHKGMYLCTAIAAGLIPLGFWRGYGIWSAQAVALVLMAALFFTAIRLYGTEQAVNFEHVMVCLFAGMVIPLFLSSLISLRTAPNGVYLVLMPVIVAFLTDTGAYFVGMTLGKHRNVTLVSPNKSAEGYVGGIFSGALVLMLYGLLLQRFAGIVVSLPIMAVYGLVGSAMTELGDLAFSLVKRQHDVKDYGDLIPGHGGMLDRFDSMIFAAPTLMLLVRIFPAF